MTRVLLYLLALLTGFSAAEAARPVPASPSSLGSAAALAAAISIGEVAKIQEETCVFRAEAVPEIPVMLGDAADVATKPSCVQRSDRSRE